MARLRLIKHFVEDLGLNLAGVELALKLTSELLGVRAQMASQEDDPESAAKSLDQIDGMLATLGLKVVPEPKKQDAQLPPPGDGWFKVNPGEAVELQQSAEESAKQRK